MFKVVTKHLIPLLVVLNVGEDVQVHGAGQGADTDQQSVNKFLGEVDTGAGWT